LGLDEERGERKSYVCVSVRERDREVLPCWAWRENSIGPSFKSDKEKCCSTKALFVSWINEYLPLPSHFKPFQSTSTHCSKKILLSSNFNPLELTSTNVGKKSFSTIFFEKKFSQIFFEN